MGYGSYTSEDWSKLKKSRKITETSHENNVFVKKSMNPKFDPKFIDCRYSRDSEDHPDSTPIIIGLDVTGSMGYLANEIAKEGLHETMMKLFSTKPVNDPQIMFSAVGDVVDDAPLQVTQFESDIRIAQQLLDLWLEGGGGDGPEDYHLLWYFAAKHTATDRFEKRGQKGYLFTIGDADCHGTLSSENIKSIFNDKCEDLTISDIAKMASEKYELFHINIVNGIKSKPAILNKALPGRILCINKENISVIPELIVSTLMLYQGSSMQDVLDSWPEQVSALLRESLKALVISNDEVIKF